MTACFAHFCIQHLLLPGIAAQSTWYTLPVLLSETRHISISFEYIFLLGETSSIRPILYNDASGTSSGLTQYISQRSCSSCEG